MAAGCIDWLPAAIVLALKKLDMWHELMRTRAVANMKFELASNLADVLAAEWGVLLAIFVKTELSLSDNDYTKLRLALCKQYNAGLMRWLGEARVVSMSGHSAPSPSP
eukprot:6184652-Pleurochrysis_carterae.AAC.2